MESRLGRLTEIVEQIGESVIVTTETVEHLSHHLTTISHQVAQQNQTLTTLTGAIQTLAVSHHETLTRLDCLIDLLHRLAVEGEDEEHTASPDASASSPASSA